MGDTATIIVAAFGSGLAGAILQPITAYVMQRLRSSEERRKSRERSLRRMLVAEMRWTRKLQALAFGTLIRQQSGLPRGPGGLDRLAQEDLPLWQPERIDDPDLHQAAVEYNKAQSRLLLAYSSQPMDAAFLNEMDEHVNELRQQITLRMDALDWPEVDD